MARGVGSSGQKNDGRRVHKVACSYLLYVSLHFVDLSAVLPLKQQRAMIPRPTCAFTLRL